MVLLSDKISRFHPRYVVLKPEQADEFKIVGFSFVVVGGGVAGAHGRWWPQADLL
jgi:hypothetical protein